jgi:hypothetical protein
MRTTKHLLLEGGEACRPVPTNGTLGLPRTAVTQAAECFVASSVCRCSRRGRNRKPGGWSCSQTLAAYVASVGCGGRWLRLLQPDGMRGASHLVPCRGCVWCMLQPNAVLCAASVCRGRTSRWPAGVASLGQPCDAAAAAPRAQLTAYGGRSPKRLLGRPGDSGVGVGWLGGRGARGCACWLCSFAHCRKDALRLPRAVASNCCVHGGDKWALFLCFTRSRRHRTRLCTGCRSHQRAAFPCNALPGSRGHAAVNVGMLLRAVLCCSRWVEACPGCWLARRCWKHAAELRVLSCAC